LLPTLFYDSEGYPDASPDLCSLRKVLAVSEKYIHSSEQKSLLAIAYAQSAYGILILNDTLPAYMTRDDVLAPFTALGLARRPNSTWTANTTRHSLEVDCEEARLDIGGELGMGTVYRSSDGCSIGLDELSNDIVGSGLDESNNEITGFRRLNNFNNETLGALPTASASYIHINKLPAAYPGYRHLDYNSGVAYEYPYINEFCFGPGHASFFAALV
jgi:hypothetical protein